MVAKPPSPASGPPCSGVLSPPASPSSEGSEPPEQADSARILDGQTDHGPHHGRCFLLFGKCGGGCDQEDGERSNVQRPPHAVLGRPSAGSMLHSGPCIPRAARQGSGAEACSPSRGGECGNRPLGSCCSGRRQPHVLVGLHRHPPVYAGHPGIEHGAWSMEYPIGSLFG